MTNGPPIATGSSMTRLANTRTRAERRRLEREGVKALAARRHRGPGDVAALRLPLLGAERGLPIEKERKNALARGHGRLERHARLERQIDQRHRPDRGEGRCKIAEGAGVEARLKARLAQSRRVAATTLW